MPRNNSNRRRAREVSLSEAARLLGRSRNGLARAIAEGLPARSETGPRGVVEWRLDLAAVLRWFEARAAERACERLAQKHAAEVERLRVALEAAEGDASEPISRAEALRRRSVAQARLAELEVAARESELVPAVEVESAWVKIATTIRAKILAAPAKLAQQLAAASDPKECHAIVEEALYEALTELAETQVEPAPDE